MLYWNRDQVFGAAGSHLASTSQFRIHVMNVHNRKTDMWKIPGGELLISVLQGACKICVNDAEHNLSVGGQILLQTGEEFVLYCEDDGIAAVAQFVWSPGISNHGNLGSERH